MTTIGTKIRNRRKELGLTVDELAERIGKNRATVYRYENDEVELSLEVVGTLAVVLGISPAYLAGWEQEKPVNNVDDGLATIAEIFTPLSPENRAKLIELGRLFVNDQNSKTEKQ